MTQKRLCHIPHFRISQYIIATLIGLLAAWLVPREWSQEEKAPPWDLFLPVVPELPKSTWWNPSSHPSFETTIHYPWVEYYLQQEALPRHTLTMDDFRCRGRGGHAPITLQEEGGKSYLFDCWGVNHGLPWSWIDPDTVPMQARKGSERIQPALMEILNELQMRLQTPVIVICGHRCLSHHNYVYHSAGPSSDKHLIGGAADFYLPEWMDRPQDIMKAIKTICKTRHNRLGLGKELVDSGSDSSYWSGREIELRYHATGSNDIDHPVATPYFEMTVRYDYEKKQDVRFSLQQARLLPLE